MKRRGFFGALAGMIAAPVAVKAAEAVEHVPQPAVVPKPEPLPVAKEWRRYIDKYSACTGMAPVSTELDDSSGQAPVGTPYAYKCPYCKRQSTENRVACECGARGWNKHRVV